MTPANPSQDARLFRADLRKYYRICFQTESPTWRQKVRLFATHFGLHCVMAYRLEGFLRRAARCSESRALAAPVELLAGAVGHALELVHHVRIYADVGPGLYIGHAGTIYVGPTTVGRNCSLTHNVTIGFGQSEGAQGVPRIGDDVWIGTGAVLSGDIQVGDGATVASGTVLSRSVPAGAFSAGNPGRAVLQGYDNGALLGAGMLHGNGAPHGSGTLHDHSALPDNGTPHSVARPAARTAGRDTAPGESAVAAASQVGT